MTKAKDPKGFNDMLEEARNLNLTWRFEEKEYPLFVANQTGNITTSLMHPSGDRKLGILSADFMWTENKPFYDHLNNDFRSERTGRDDESVRKVANATRKNATLFDDLVQRGSFQKIDSFGESGDIVEKSRDEMLAFQPEIKSQLIDDWLGAFSAERYFAPGTDETEDLLTGTDTLQIIAKIGDLKSPAHALLFTFATPSPDARRAFEDDTVFVSSKQQGDRVIEKFNVKHERKLAFAQKYFKGVEGAVNGPNGELEPHTEALTLVGLNPGEFKTAFNPHWWIRLANALNGAFDFTGK